MRRPRRRSLSLLLLVMMGIHGTSAVTLRRRDSLEDGHRLKRDRLFCKECPAGTHLAEECTELNRSGRCEDCGKGEYTAYPNILEGCQQCLTCREDQVEQSPCQPDRNTVCACRNGTFCHPDHPCEMCQKCQLRCPEGQTVLQPCRPDSDLQCGPATDTMPIYIPVIFGVMAFVFVFGILFCLWKCCCSSPGDGRPSSTRPYEVVSSMFRKLPWCRSARHVGAEDNAANERLQDQQPPVRAVLLPRMRPAPSRREMLVPVPESGRPDHVLRKAFYVIAAKLLHPDWKRFGRSLDLEENDIVTTTSDNDFYDMLLKWQNREGLNASVNRLLQVLDELGLVGVADQVSSALVNDGLFQYETS